jgi:Xaa-Pro aminopeptidase
MNQHVIAASEFKERAARVQQRMAENGIDLLLAFSTEAEPAYVRYLSDYWPSFETAGVLVPVDGSPALLIGPESLTYGKARSKIDRILQLEDFRESSQPEYPGTTLPTWADIFDQFPVERLGIAGWHMFPHAIYENIRDAARSAEIIEGDHVMRSVMIKKSAAEINCLRESARLSEIGLQAILDQIKPGLTEIQVAAIGTAAMLAHGAEATGYPVWCCSGPNTVQAISRPTHRKIGEGEIIHVQIGAKVAGYSTSIGRPIVLGFCPDKMRRFLQVGCQAANLTIELMQSGTVASTVAQRVHGWITEQGYGDTILYGPAHGNGQMECEWPFIETSCEVVLESNMTFQVDVFLAKPDMGFRWEDAIVVCEGAAEELSSLRREVIVI